MTATARRLNIAQEIARENDTDWEEHTLTKVDAYTHPHTGWTLAGERGTCWGLSAEYGVVPKVGDTIRLYGSFGRPIVGQDLNGEPLYYKTEVMQKYDHALYCMELEQKRAAEFEAKRDELDAA